MSVVVLPMSTSKASPSRCANRAAVACQLAEAMAAEVASAALGRKVA